MISLTLLPLPLEQRLDRILKDKQALDKQKQDRLITTLSSTLTTAVNTKMDKLIRTEIKNCILPGIGPLRAWSKDLAVTELLTSVRRICDFHELHKLVEQGFI